MPAPTRDDIVSLLNSVGFAVLATERAGQPHTSLVAITPVDGWHRLVFATQFTELKPVE